MRITVAAVGVVLSAACATGVEGAQVAELRDPCTIDAEALLQAGIDRPNTGPDSSEQGKKQ